jgi:hypothetical protein
MELVNCPSCNAIYEKINFVMFVQNVGEKKKKTFRQSIPL